MITATEQSRDGLEFYRRLIDGDEAACRDLAYRLHEEDGASVLRLCEALTEAFHQIGDAWETAQLPVYREHIASQVGFRLLLEFRDLLAPVALDAPAAIGCAPEDDPYILPTLMVELVLLELGWRAQSLGANLPLELLAPAMDDTLPRLCWVSVSHVQSAESLRAQLSSLAEHGRRRGITVICGGRGLDDRLMTGGTNINFLRELRELTSCPGPAA